MLVFALLFLKPACFCPAQYIALALIGLIPLLCGPRLYRWLAGVYILIALVFAAYEHRGALRQSEQYQRMQRMRGEAHAQHP